MTLKNSQSGNAPTLSHYVGQLALYFALFVALSLLGGLLDWLGIL